MLEDERRLQDLAGIQDHLRQHPTFGSPKPDWSDETYKLAKKIEALHPEVKGDCIVGVQYFGKDASLCATIGYNESTRFTYWTNYDRYEEISGLGYFYGTAMEQGHLRPLPKPIPFDRRLAGMRLGLGVITEELLGDLNHLSEGQFVWDKEKNTLTDNRPEAAIGLPSLSKPRVIQLDHLWSTAWFWVSNHDRDRQLLDAWSAVVLKDFDRQFSGLIHRVEAGEVDRASAIQIVSKDMARTTQKALFATATDEAGWEAQKRTYARYLYWHRDLVGGDFNMAQFTNRFRSILMPWVCGTETPELFMEQVEEYLQNLKKIKS